MIDLSELLDDASKDIPVGGGRTWRLYPPSAWDRLQLEQHLRKIVKNPRMPSSRVWSSVSRIVLDAGPQPGGHERATRELPVEVSVPLVWWGWLHWCRGEQFADEWVRSLGKATVARMATTLAPTRSTSTSTASARKTRSPGSTTRTGSRPASQQASDPAQPTKDLVPAGATSSTVSGN